MNAIEFSVPYNENTNSLEETFKMKDYMGNKITEIYLSGPQEYSASGRVMDKLGMDNFLKTVKKIHSAGIRVNLVINPTCEGDEWYSPGILKKTLDYLKMLHREYDVEVVTIANPIYISEVRRYLPEIEICASVLGDVDSIQRAVIYANLGANIITPDVSINRNLKLLQEIKKETRTKLRIMVNEGCLYKCPFRKFHFNHVSHQSKKSGIELVFLPYCNQVIREDPSQILKSGWIRPEDTRKYTEITNFFKVVGRDLPNSKVIRAIKAYMEESWDGDLMDIVASSLGSFALKYGIYLDNKKLGEVGFFEKIISCGQNCYQCHYCKEVAKELIEVIGYTEEKMADKKLTGRIDYLRDEGLIT
jgi:collagenase-like PrtC family protease